ncbi:MAG: 3'(2'),5'-bisphosphate nucleotidase CysQ [Acidimicrobiia bacterium]
MDRDIDLARIAAALQAAREALAPFTPGRIASRLKDGWDPVTAADTAVNEVLENVLPEAGEGWLSEETADSSHRLGCRRVWVVDPVDGTREFIAGIPEWCISVGLVEDGVPVAGGILNPTYDELVLGAVETGVTCNGRPVRIPRRSSLKGIRVLASRSEVKRGEWDRYGGAPFTVEPMGSVAYKMARVGAGLDVATWTLVPKHEWDVAAGTALVRAAGGDVITPSGEYPSFNQPSPKLDGLIAAGPGVMPAVREYLGV